MNAATKLGAYLLGLAVLFGGALGVGRAAGPVATPPGDGHTASRATGHGSARPAGGDTPGGLQVSANGYTLTPLPVTIRPGEAADYRFTVTGPDGAPVTGYQVRHDKRLHLIVVSRDLGHFQHVHPVLTGGGVWSVPLTLPSAGAYRVLADFAPTGGDALTLGADLLVPGGHTPKPLPRTGRTATVGGYTVTLAGDLVPGRAGGLTLMVSKNGRPVTDLQPYLGAYGHLVALRAGDLAYLHVHPDGTPGDGVTKAGPGIAFQAEVPSRGDYRLFLDFRHGGEVRTAAFTLTAVQATGAAPETAPGGHGDHGH
ncbi:hypothetical protein DQ384_24200 [Sphaerisporangium album]|uniref:Secreted protein n=1 Tax=Sphaerisporangium album TaxID=509200 RepID=A0A367FEW8_9ACTN|nr:hypothetical protein [Sphaerisporangium album]RCG28237.1 hypothetical protein DQ384_24200 [Sphaerisporangium album]